MSREATLLATGRVLMQRPSPDGAGPPGFILAELPDGSMAVKFRDLPLRVLPPAAVDELERVLTSRRLAAEAETLLDLPEPPPMDE